MASRNEIYPLEGKFSRRFFPCLRSVKYQGWQPGAWL